MIFQPLAQLEFGCKIVIIIDALDESGKDEAIAGLANRSALVQTIVKKFAVLPSFVKIIITAREEGSIQEFFGNKSFIFQKRMDEVLDTGSDIAKYLQFQFQKIRNVYKLPKDWPGRNIENQLVIAADNLFVWPVVACSLIQKDPHAQLNNLLQLGFRLSYKKHLDTLYMHILNTNYEEMDNHNWHYIVGTIVILRTPLTLDSLDLLLQLSPKNYSKTLITGDSITLSSSRFILEKMLPLLRNQLEKGHVQLLHKSVYDFLLHKENIPFAIDVRAQNQVVAMQCISHMNQTLTYNICNIENTALLNNEIAEPVNHYISESLQYACCFFVSHLERSLAVKNLQLLEAIDCFVQKHILHWMEAMSWLEKVVDATNILKAFLQYLVCYD